jgi:hypothetical protein
MPILTRTTNVDSSLEATRTVCGHVGHEPIDVNFVWPGYSRTFEAMTPNSSKDQHSWKSFAHYKREWTPAAMCLWRGAVDNHVDEDIPRRYDYVQSSNPMAWYCGEFGEPGYPIDGLLKLYDPASDSVVPDPPGLNELNSRARRALLPLIKAELSVLNSIIELKDLKTIDHTLESIVQTGRRLFLDVKIKANPGATLRSLLRSSADGYLQEKFNILPLLSDLAGIHSALSATRGRINALVAGQGQTQTRHFAATVDVPSNLVEDKTFYSPQPLGGYAYACAVPNGVVSYARRYVYVDKAQFHAEMRYNYNYNAYQLENAQLLGLLDALGFNLNPAIIWNSIRWSFVIDWVLGVSRWLDDRKVLNMEPVINIQDYLWSVTYRRRVLVSRVLERETVFHDIGGNEYAKDTQGPLGSMVETAYRRTAGLPTVSSITSSGLSLTEFSLGAALVITSGSHKHHRSR